jgi:hypothetical protein
MTDSRSRIVLHHNDIRDVTFQLRRLGRREPFDVTGEALRLSVERLDTPQDDNNEPLTADPLHPGADYANGTVVFQIPREITSRVGTYRYSLGLAQNDGQYFVLQTGKMEVKDRPGSAPLWTLTGIIDVEVTLTGTFAVT